MTENPFAYFHSELPFVIKNGIKNWKVLQYTEDDWCKELNDEVLRFRQGPKKYKDTPFWESECHTNEMTLKEFFDLSKKKREDWCYFDYHYMKDVFKENLKLLDDIRWADINLTGLTGKDSTLWIGSEGAHTSCHLDTYGCNFVAQIRGRKRWILMPPNETENLKPTRVPYEESSVYSSLNFYTPTNKLLSLNKCYTIILSPGDVLFVPRHWWHYVENLETSITINVWVPLELDHESRLDEALVRYYISSVCKDLTEEESKLLLNPNESSLVSETRTLDLVQECLGYYQKLRLGAGEGVRDVKSFYSDVVPVEDMDLVSYLTEKSEMFKYDLNIQNEPPTGEINSKLFLVKSLINSYCHPHNVAAMRKSLLLQFNNR